MASFNVLRAFMAIIMLVGAVRVLLSLVYLDERMVAIVQTPYLIPTEVKRHNMEEHVKTEQDSGHALNDLLEKFQEGEKAAPRQEMDLKVEIDAAKSEAAKKVSYLETRLKKLKGKWLHEKLKFWTPTGSKSCPMAGDGLYLLSVINSEPLNALQRRAIRTTWGSQRSVEGENVTSVFMVGHPTSAGTATSLKNKITLEYETYGDVIGTHVIKPKRLTTASTMRILATFKWVLINCPLVQYVFIGPENIFVHQVNLIKYLKSLNNPKHLYLGRVRKDGKPQRDPLNKDFVDVKTYRPEMYPKYCVGGAGFVVSTQFIHDVYLKSVTVEIKTQNFVLGDVYLGMMALNLKIWPKYKDSFRKQGGDADYCDLRDTITLGGLGSEYLMKSVWRNHNMVVEHCPNAIPNATEIEQWTRKVDNRGYFNTVLKFIHHPKKTCWKDPKTRTAPYLLALVSSMPEHFELRQAIRQTWASPDYMTKTDSKTLFILGKSPGMSVGIQEAVDDEARLNGDILQADFLESFHNLTLKVILGLRWVTVNCKQVSFIYKGDDDMLVNFERITDHLKSLPSNQSLRLFFGHMMGLSPVVRQKSRYQVLRSQYPFKYFLPYFSGGGYIMSLSAVRDMYTMTLSTKIIPIDDAYVGILAYRSRSINLSAASSKYFITTGSRKDACDLRQAFNTHGFKTTSVMKETWAAFRDESSQCEEESKKPMFAQKNL